MHMAPPPWKAWFPALCEWSQAAAKRDLQFLTTAADVPLPPSSTPSFDEVTPVTVPTAPLLPRDPWNDPRDSNPFRPNFVVLFNTNPCAIFLQHDRLPNSLLRTRILSVPTPPPVNHSLLIIPVCTRLCGQCLPGMVLFPSWNDLTFVASLLLLGWWAR